MNVIDWILEGDVSVQYLTKENLLGFEKCKIASLRNKILKQGFGLELCNIQDLNTYMWGGGIYSPKYISTHYTLLELCQLGAPIFDKRFHFAIEIMFSKMWINKGQVRPYRHQDLCVVAMMVRIASHARFQDARIDEMVDYILEHQMDDGGWNCAWERKKKPKQSSLHTTLSVLEAFDNYKKNGYTYQLNKVNEVIPQGVEYIFSKQLYLSVRKEEVIHKDMLSFPFPYNWRYDILRALEVMSSLKITYDERMEGAIDIIIDRLDVFGRIKADRKPPSLMNIRYTSTNKLCRFNTYRVLKVLNYYRTHIYTDYLNKQIS